MPNVATFIFYGVLQDFIRKSDRNKPVVYTFSGKPSVKDAIEAIGIPHPEVARISKNSQPQNFDAPLLDRDYLHVYPHDQYSTWPNIYLLTQEPGKPYKFILDVHLGTLAKTMRMLGFDAKYEQNLNDAHIAGIAYHENRIVLTRDLGLLKQKIIKHGYWLRSQHTTEQVKEVISRFNLTQYITPFVRCLRCNSLLMPVAKEQVQEKLPTKTRLYFNEFYQCSCCGKVYWKGSHYEHMQSVIQHLVNKRNKNSPG